MNLNQTIEAARNVLRFKHMAIKTEKSYTHWIRRFAFWCKDHSAGSHEDKVRGFLTHLARERDVSVTLHFEAPVDGNLETGCELLIAEPDH